jgi:hypothetical protein
MGSSDACPHCRDAAKFHRWQPKTIVSVLGDIRFDRAYYYCSQCKTGHFPGDQALHLTHADHTPGAEQLIALTGILDSFATAADKALRILTGIRLSESTVERTTEAVGERLGTTVAERKTIGVATPWAWHRDAEGKTCAYVSADATGVSQQGPKGAKAENRMANVVMIYNPVPEERERWANPQAARRPDWKARYLSGLAPMPKQLEQLRPVGEQVGMNAVDRWIALSDGGSGLEEALRVNFPRVEAVILDFWHAAEHVHEFAQMWEPGDGGQTLGATWCEEMKSGGGKALLTRLRGLAVGRRSAGVKEGHRQLVGYLENQQHRMDYPTYKQKGWQIGSGPVEAACKGVIGKRLKGSGMRWGEAGTDAMCHLRALWCSADAQWDIFWNVVI